MRLIHLLVIGCFCFTSTCFANNLSFIKEKHKYQLIKSGESIQAGVTAVIIADRLEADALLELSKNGYDDYISYKEKTKKRLRHANEILLIMPRIDLLSKYLTSLSKMTDQLYIFVMEDDKLDTPLYGDRSYQTLKRSGLDEKLPSNTKLFKLKNESVSYTGSRNNFEISDIQTSLVFKNQIKPLYTTHSLIRIFK